MANPPPYNNITGISRAVMKDNAQTTLVNYDGNARPGELVVNLETDPPALYVGNNIGQLTAITSGGGASLPLSNGTSNFDIATASGDATITAGARTWTFATSGALDVPKFGTYDEYGRVRGDGLQLRGDTNGGGSYTYIILPNNTDSATTAVTVSNDVGNVLIYANGNTWTFDNAGTLSAPGNISAGNIGVSERVTCQSVVTDPVNLGSLTPVFGARAFILDGNLTAAGNFGAQVSGGGSNTVPVWSDGANWFIG